MWIKLFANFYSEDTHGERSFHLLLRNSCQHCWLWLLFHFSSAMLTNSCKQRLQIITHLGQKRTVFEQKRIVFEQKKNALVLDFARNPPAVLSSGPSSVSAKCFRMFRMSPKDHNGAREAQWFCSHREHDVQQSGSPTHLLLHIHGSWGTWLDWLFSSSLCKVDFPVYNVCTHSGGRIMRLGYSLRWN